jgi:hypothetical protein
LNEKASQDAMNIIGNVEHDLESIKVVLSMLSNASRKFGIILKAWRCRMQQQSK